MADVSSNRIETPPTRVTSTERFSAWITAWLVCLGVLVALMFLLWWFGTLRSFSNSAIAIGAAADSESIDRDVAGENADEPDVEEFPEVETPQVADTLEAVPDAVSNIQGVHQATDGDANKNGRGIGRHPGTPGPPGPGPYDNPQPWARWQIEYSVADIDTYIRQLAHFGIAIGVVSMETDRIDVVSNLGANPVVTSSTRKEQQDQIHFRHRRRKLLQWDEQIVGRAGISNLQGRALVQFYPKGVTNELARLEAEFAAKVGSGRRNARG